MKGAQIQAAIAVAAEEESLKPEEFGTHSLRFGGASALWAAYQDTTLVQRWGRWRSQAFQGYLWEAKDNAQGIARDMAKADLTLV